MFDCYDFKFDCDNCFECFCFEDFIEIINLWGMIYFTGEKDALVGITCPSCIKTTIKKFPLDTASSLIKHLQNANEILDLNYIIPFSPEILKNSSLLDTSPIVKSNGEYHISEEFKLYPDVADRWKRLVYKNDTFQFAFEEQHLDILINIENKKMLKAFPRIAVFDNIYHIYDSNFLFDASTEHLFLERYSNGVYETLQERFELYAQKKSFLGGKEEKNSLKDKLVKDNLTQSFYCDVPNYSTRYWGSQGEYEKILGFIHDYKKIRNRIDFEIIYREELIYKYIRLWFYSPNWELEILAQCDDEGGQIAKQALDKVLSEQGIPDEEAGLQTNDNDFQKPEDVTTSETQEQVSQADTEHSGLETEVPAKNNLKQNEDNQSNNKFSPNSDKEFHPLKEEIENKYNVKDNYFIKIGEIWNVKFNGKFTQNYKKKCYRYVLHLIDNPYKPIYNINLVQIANQLVSIEPSEINSDLKKEDLYEDNLTKEDKETYRKQIKDLLDKKQSADTEDKKKEINIEIQKVVDFFKKEFGGYIKISNDNNKLKIFGREKVLLRQAENARINVKENITASLKYYKKELPELYTHLNKCIKTELLEATYRPGTDGQFVELKVYWD